MIKDRLHTISNEDAIEVAKILLKTSESDLYNYSYDKITRIEYNLQDGVDSEESVNVYFNATVKDDLYRKSGWKDEKICIKLVEKDRYHDYPYFYAIYNKGSKSTWSYKFLSNHIEAVEYLQNNQIL